MDRAFRLRLAMIGVCAALVVAAGLTVAFTVPDPGGPAARPGDTPAGAGSDGSAAAVAASPGEPLRRLAERRGIRIGTAVDTAALVADGRYRAVLGREFSSVTPENSMKWAGVEAVRGVPDRSAADRLVEFARRENQAVYGHTLVWHNQLPPWLHSPELSAPELREALRQRIQDEMSHFKGAVWAWDVVNEPLADDGTLRDTLWLKQLGPDYIADAFRWARAADPNARLYLNEYGAEGVNRKSDALYELVRDLLAAGVPIDGIGFQTHWRLTPLPDSFAENLRRFAELGLEVAITELDVRMQLPATGDRLAAQARTYAEAVGACLEVSGCVAVTVWGFTDAYSWVPRFHPGAGAAAIFDTGYAPKPAYGAVATALRG